jgi:hypothetical protein
VSADYTVSYAGLSIGRFRYQSTVDGRGYTISGSSKLSALLGAFKYRGTTSSSGRLDADRLEPDRHAFDYRANNKKGSLAIGYEGRRVASVEITPKRKPSSRAVPVEAKHKVDAIDPLSAVMSIMRGTPSDACRRQFAIFDGKQRFNLVFSPAGEEQLSNGSRGTGIVCQVRYQPVAGHKPNDNTKALMDARIELVLQAVPDEGLLVPHEVRVPTSFGPVALKAERFDYQSARRGRIALLRGNRTDDAE